MNMTTRNCRGKGKTHYFPRELHESNMVSNYFQYLMIWFVDACKMENLFPYSTSSIPG